jgi:hypothetical protein
MPLSLIIGNCHVASTELQVVIDSREVKAEKANRAASALGRAMTKTLADLRPTFAATYGLDEQLVTLAIAKASVAIAADAASQAMGMASEECDELEERMFDVVFDAIEELEATEGREK